MEPLSGAIPSSRIDATQAFVDHCRYTLGERISNCSKALQATLCNTSKLTRGVFKGAVLGAMIGGIPNKDWEASPVGAVVRGALLGCVLGALYEIWFIPSATIPVEAEQVEGQRNLAVNVDPLYGFNVVDVNDNEVLPVDHPLFREPLRDRILSIVHKAKPFLLGNSIIGMCLGAAALSEGVRRITIIQSDSKVMAYIDTISNITLMAIIPISVVFNTKALSSEFGSFASLMAINMYTLLSRISGSQVANGCGLMLLGAAITTSRIGYKNFAANMITTTLRIGVPGAIGAGVGAIAGKAAFGLVPTFHIVVNLMEAMVKAAAKNEGATRGSQAFGRALIQNHLSSLPQKQQRQVGKNFKILWPETLNQFPYLMIEGLMRSQQDLNVSNTSPMVHTHLSKILPLQQAFRTLTQKEKFSILGDNFTENPALLRDAKALGYQWTQDPLLMKDVTQLLGILAGV